MTETKCAISGFIAEKTNCYSVLMVLTTLAFVAFMAAGTAAFQVKLNAEASPQGNPSVSSVVRHAIIAPDQAANG